MRGGEREGACKGHGSQDVKRMKVNWNEIVREESKDDARLSLLICDA